MSTITRAAMALATAALQACAQFQLPDGSLSMSAPFLVAEQERPTAVKVTWDTVESPDTECRSGHAAMQKTFGEIMACAFWNTTKNTCRIVTGTKTTHEALGHELRHCFEGKFHD